MLASYAFTDRLWLFVEADTVPFAAPVKWSASVVKSLAEHRAVAVMRSKNLLAMTPSVELVSKALGMTETEVRRAARRDRLGYVLMGGKAGAWRVCFSYRRKMAEIPATIIRPEDAAQLEIFWQVARNA